MDTAIARLIELYATHAGRAVTTVSRRAGGSGGLYARLRRGHDITTRRAARILQWLSDHWPEGADWPADIPRPPPSTATTRPSSGRDPNPPPPASLKRAHRAADGRAPARRSGGGDLSAAVLAEVRALEARRQTALDDPDRIVEAAELRDAMLAAALQLGPDGQIASSAALCLALGVTRRVYRRTVAEYGRGGGRAGQRPRQLADGRHTDTGRMYIALAGSGDVRFTPRRRPQAAA